MVEQLARNWWILALRGLAGVLFGLGAFLWPGLTLVVLIALFGAYALVDGIFALAAAVKAVGHSEHRMPAALAGMVGIATGLVMLFWPGVTVLVLVYIMAAWAIVTGVLEIAAAIRLRNEIAGEWLLGLSGVVSLVLGVLLLFMPTAGALAFVWMLGGYAIFYGILLIALAFRLRRYKQEFQRHAPA